MRNDYVVYIHKNILNGKVYVGQTCNLSERWRNNGKNYFNSIKFYNAIKKYGWDNFTHEVVYSNLNKQAADKLEKELIHKYNSIEEGYNLKEGGSRGELSTKSLAKMSESLKRGYSEFPERREKIRNKALGRKMPKDTRCKISLNHSKSNLLKINDEVGSNRFGDRFRDSGMRGNDMDRIIKYMRHSMNDGEHFTESEAMDLVSDMYHTEGGRKYSGEKFDIHKAKEICERYRGVIPVSATPTDVYVAINSQYHDYVELFKSWFGDNVDQKMIESAIIFWFKDVDCKSRNKVVSYFKEY